VASFLRGRGAAPVRLSTVPARQVLAAVLVLGIVFGLGLGWMPGRLRAVTHRTPPATALRHVTAIVHVVETVCPRGEVRFDEIDGAYHVCRPAYWVTRSYNHTDGYQGVISAVGLGVPLPPTSGRESDRSNAMEMMITVAYDNRDNAEQNLGLSAPTMVTVAGQPADMFAIHEADGSVSSTLILVERGDRLYRLELHGGGAVGQVEFNEMVRTFSFQGLPYYADPEFKLEHNTA
jgi:hypothetical protein